MAEEEINDTTEETPDAVEPAAEAEAQDAAAPAETQPADDAATAAPARETEEVVAPKERRRRHRAARAAKVKPRPPRTAEERHDERIAERRAKAELRRQGRAKAKAKAAHTRAEPTPPREHVEGVQKVRQGVVVSDKADKTITVRIDTARRHRRYKKIVRTSRTLHAHDERNDANIGDTVIVREARPLSRTKRWRLVQVVERAK
jgi:small subunit ribosomal protein S17